MVAGLLSFVDSLGVADLTLLKMIGLDDLQCYQQPYQLCNSHILEQHHTAKWNPGEDYADEVALVRSTGSILKSTYQYLHNESNQVSVYNTLGTAREDYPYFRHWKPLDKEDFGFNAVRL